MRSSRQGSIPSPLGWLIDTLDEYEARLRTLEAPSGEALGSTVAKLQALVANLQATLDGWTSSFYVNGQIDAKDAAVAGSIGPTIAAALAGNVTVGGAFYSPNAYATDITWTRRQGAVGNDGRFGYVPSSRRKKTAIVAADEERLRALLDVEPKTFRYRAQMGAGDELGLIAEELDEAGLRELVYYDETGTPEGIEYGMLSVPLLAIFRGQRGELADVRREIADLARETRRSTS